MVFDSSNNQCSPGTICDTRVQNNATLSPTVMRVGQMSIGGSFTMIGPNTAVTAAHASWNNGGILQSDLRLGAYNYGPANGNYVHPYGTYAWGSYYLWFTTAWQNGAGAAGHVTNASNHPEMDWDFAVIDFSPDRYPGYSSGWYGTEELGANYDNVYLQNYGYPGDNSQRWWSQWRTSRFHSSKS